MQMSRIAGITHLRFWLFLVYPLRLPVDMVELAGRNGNGFISIEGFAPTKFLYILKLSLFNFFA